MNYLDNASDENRNTRNNTNKSFEEIIDKLKKNPTKHKDS